MAIQKYGGAGGTSFDTLIADLEAQQEKSNLANQKRYEQMMAIFDETIRRYQPGGTFQTEALRQLGKEKERTVGGEEQKLISSGLFGTTTRAALGGKFEEERGDPYRLKLEDVMMQRLTQAQLGKAGAMERVEDVGPDYGTVAQLAGQYGQGMGDYTPGGASTTGSMWGNFQQIGGMDWLRAGGPFAGGGGSYTPGGGTTAPTTGGGGGAYVAGGATDPATQSKTTTTAPTTTRTGGWTKGGQTAYWGGKRDYDEWATEMRKLGWSPK